MDKLTLMSSSSKRRTKRPDFSTCTKKRRLGTTLKGQPVIEELKESNNCESDKTEVHEDDKEGAVNISKLRSTKTETVKTKSTIQTQKSHLSQSKQVVLSDDTCRNRVEILGKYNVREKSDKIECDIQDICQLPDGGFLITDRYNMKLKRLHHTYDVIGSFRFKTAPHSVCSIDADQGAVSLISHKKVAIISLGKKMKLERSFSTRNYCRGMVFSKGMLYVCCGDVTNPSSGTIEVFTKSGQLLRHFTSFLIQSSVVPVNITINDLGDHLFFTSCNTDDITETDLAGNVVKTFCYKNLQVPSRLCTNGQGQVFICGTNNDTIALLGSTNDIAEVIVSATDGIKTPIAVCFDVKQSKFVISCVHSDELFVYQLLQVKL